MHGGAKFPDYTWYHEQTLESRRGIAVSSIYWPWDSLRSLIQRKGREWRDAINWT